MKSRPWSFAVQTTALSGLQEWIGRILFYSTQGILCIEADCRVREQGYCISRSKLCFNARDSHYRDCRDRAGTGDSAQSRLTESQAYHMLSIAFPVDPG